MDFYRLTEKVGDNVYWIDITGQEQKLSELGVDPVKALTEQHVKGENERIVSEIDTFLLMIQVPVLKPVAGLIGLS